MAKDKKGIKPIIDRVPPQNIEAEVSVLGSLLLDKEAILKIADIIRSSDFYNDALRVIYDAMIELFDHRQPIDLVTLTNKLEEKEELDKIGGASYLTTLANSVPSAAHVVHYAQIVSEKATLRRLIQAGSEVTNLAFFKEGQNLGDILDEAEKLIFSVSQSNLKQNFIHIKSVLTESFDRIDELHKDKGKVRGVPTGFLALDNLLAGLQNSDLVVVAGRPSMGKTSFALNIAQHISTKDGIPVGIFSLEMSKEQLVDRLLCAEAGIDSWKLRTGNLEDDDFPQIGRAMGILSEAPIFIDDSATSNVLEIRTKARRLQTEHGIGLIVVDYLQLMQGETRGSDNRVQEISEISRSLKALARELRIPVIAISQLSREVEKRPSRIPQLADLRESGAIEQDADVVIFVYREDYYDPETERKNIADIFIKKHRNGPTGQIELFFHPEFMAFRNLEKKREAAEV